MSKKVYICYDPNEGISSGAGKGTTLKQAYDDYRESADYPVDADDCLFIEGEEIAVEVKIERKEVVTKITAAAKPAAK